MSDIFTLYARWLQIVDYYSPGRWNVRVAFELGRHEWFAPRRLITKLEVLHTPWFLKFCSSQNRTSVRNNLKATSRDSVFWRSPTVCPFKMADRRIRSQLLDVAWQYCDCSLVFPCSNFYTESLVICLWNKARVYLTLWKQHLRKVHVQCMS